VSVVTPLLFVLPQQEYGGLHRLVEFLAAPLTDAGFDVHALVPAESNARQRMSPMVRVSTAPQLFNVPSPKHPVRFAHHLLTARRRAAAVAAALPVPPSIVHTFGFTDFVGAPLATRFRAALVRSANSSIIPAWADAYARAVMGRADATLFEGTVLARRYGPRRSGRPSGVFYPAWDGAAPGPAVHQAELRGALGIPTGAFVVGTWSNVTRQKGLETFVRYAKATAPRNAAIHFLIAGRVPPGHGPYLEAVRRGAAAPELHGRFHFAVDGELDRNSIFATIDVLAQTSVYEGVATSTVEAMAAALPVIAHDVGSVSDLVRSAETGALIRPGATDAFIAALLELQADPALAARQGAKAQEVVRDLCTSARLATAYLDVYQAVRDARG
jgi:glycosyltransferase involved in cell wall biosynthesis